MHAAKQHLRVLLDAGGVAMTPPIRIELGFVRVHGA
jgi:hypothetical protein